ncbi:MAG: hypothetical protein LAT55_01150 [Opitutales bacterium]|nr:hypothetical protein [Opitutales bacterium]
MNRSYPDSFLPDPINPPFWSCLRTRPRWEKKMARWLEERDFGYFLPLVNQKKTSHRKTRITEIALFPGYVFVQGDYGKGDFQETGAVVYVLKPKTPGQQKDLAENLESVRCILAAGRDPRPLEEYRPGQKIIINQGTLAGVRGEILEHSAPDTITVWIELLGRGLSLPLTPEDLSLLEDEEA